jgi:hypothetical protein
MVMSEVELTAPAGAVEGTALQQEVEFEVCGR